MTPSYTKITKSKVTRFYLTVYHDRKQLRLSTGISVPMQCVSDSEFLPINTKHVSHAALNERLRRCKQVLEGVIIQYQNENKQELPSFKFIRDEYNRIIHLQEPIEYSIQTLWKRFMKYQLEDRGENCVSGESAAQYSYLFANMEEFAEKRNLTFRLALFNEEGCEKLKDYLLEQKRAAKTIFTKLSMLRVFLKFCKNELKIKVEIPTTSIKMPKRDKNKIVITNTEIELLMNLNLDGIDKRVRDACVLEGEISTRIGDLSTISPALHIQNREVQMDKKTVNWPHLIKETKKVNGKEVNVPLTKLALRIFEEYNWASTSTWIPNSRILNKQIKTICKEAGGSFLTNVEIVTGSGKYLKKKIVPRWKLVTSHCFRRAFIDKMLALGLTAQDVGSMTGQEGQTIQIYYAKPSQERVINAMRILDGVPDANPEPKERNANESI